ncbi:uncharacterized protein [Montipora foliosa]|uniref:uncharacterized protein n=1 Tax=Montipora foliosa TaxID=591990 RepID=UPI0035F1291C
MADSSASESSSNSGSDFSDFEASLEGKNNESALDPVGEIRPWRFEPPGRNGNQVRESDEEQQPVRSGCLNQESHERCQCGNCQSMWREEENICCQEVDAAKNKNLEPVTVEELQAEPGCIVQHPGFEAVCLNVWVLQTAWLQYKQQYGSSAYEGPEHKKNRHIAYRQLVRWCWGALGKNIWAPLPSCAVNCKLRTAYFTRKLNIPITTER